MRAQPLPGAVPQDEAAFRDGDGLPALLHEVPLQIDQQLAFAQIVGVGTVNPDLRSQAVMNLDQVGQ